jgi:hypothetical protein
VRALRLVTQRSETREPVESGTAPVRFPPTTYFAKTVTQLYRPLHAGTCNIDRYTHPCTPIPSDPTDPIVPERPRASPSLPSAVMRHAAQYTR